MKDIKASIRKVMKTGKVKIGSKSTIDTILSGDATLIVISENCQRDIKNKILYYSKLSAVPCKSLNVTTLELGSLCGKPYSVSSFAVIDAGDSNINQAIQSD